MRGSLPAKILYHPQHDILIGTTRLTLSFAERSPWATLRRSDDFSVSMVKTGENRYKKCLNMPTQIYTSSVDKLKSLKHVMWYLMAKKHVFAIPRHKASIGIDTPTRDGHIAISES